MKPNSVSAAVTAVSAERQDLITEVFCLSLMSKLKKRKKKKEINYKDETRL